MLKIATSNDGDQAAPQEERSAEQHAAIGDVGEDFAAHQWIRQSAFSALTGRLTAGMTARRLTIWPGSAPVFLT